YVIINVPKASVSYSGVSALKDELEKLGKDYTRIKNLKVTGEINVWDFWFMRDEMTALRAINLKEAEVVEMIIPLEAFYNKSTLSRIVFPENITRISSCAFWGTSLIGSLIIPNSVTVIDELSFGYNNSLTGSLVLPDNLVEIGNSAFCECRFTGNLELPRTLKKIGNLAFSSNRFTGELKLPENIESLGESAFSGCRFTGDLTIPEQITEIPNWAFSSCRFDGQLTLPHNLQRIGDGAFCCNSFSGELNLPKDVYYIGANAFWNTTFSGTLKLPESLEFIGPYAFQDCCHLTGTLEIPSGITTILEYTFCNLCQIDKLILPKNLDYIADVAFANCFQLNSIVCNAHTPPTLASSVFEGVPKDNFVLEVPEASVVDYSSAIYWNEFKRIAALHDFSISRRLFRTLNARDKKTLILRALSGEAWSIESKPDWVTVTPENGVGKTEVTITIDELARGNGNREGEVVFLLDNKDYRSRTKVEQYDYEYGDGDVITYQSASKGEGVNLVFMGDCFDAKDITEGKYLNGTTEAIEHFFAVEPYRSYRDYFNVYIVFGLSSDSGIGTVNTIREAKFGSQYTLGEGIAPNDTICFEYACKAATVTPENISETVVVLVENSSEYGGICYMWADGSAIAVCPMSEDAYPYDFRGLVQHEAGGHGFGKLGDEYIYDNSFISTCPKCYPKLVQGQSLGWYQNLSLTGNMYDVPWSHLIFDAKYQNTVDIYEGGFEHTRGVFRSEPTSCMNNNIPYFSAISREEIVKRIKKYAGEEFSFEEWKANDVALATDNSEQTRSLTTFSSYLSRGKQCEPVFMGDKPCFKSNK
ncbi:MAG: leucine-rich repeat protein, partial [Bacteroidaceae bacterium]|nr:leucine-rich repeat protein [Bacteroidaceae bacterium]